MTKYLFFVFIASISFSCAVKKPAVTTSTVTGYKFDFGGPKIDPGFKTVNTSHLYTDALGFGFEGKPDLLIVNRPKHSATSDGFVTSTHPFYFSVKLPEGNYNVKIVMGDADGTSDATVRAECRRMMVNRVQTTTGEIKTVEFSLHIRDSIIRATNTKVRLKPREINYLHWDNKLTLEFNGITPKVNAIEITPANDNVTTVFLAGNSTVVDQAEEPYAAWGQMIPNYFKSDVAIANYAESGETLNSFIGERRFEKMITLMKTGDYAFVEFGHNDQKQRGEGIGAFTSYTKDLKYFINEVKKKGGIPVLVTSMQRRNFDSLGNINHTLGDYPDAVRAVAKEMQVALIDLNVMSKTMYEAWGPKESIKAFVHFPANTYPNQKVELKDDTHFRPFGADQIAQIIIKGIRENVPALATHLKSNVPTFNPSRPGKIEDFYWPLSPTTASIKPDGN